MTDIEQEREKPKEGRARDEFSGELPEWATDRMHINVDNVKLRFTDRLRILWHGRIFFDCRANLQHKAGRRVIQCGFIVPRFSWPGWLRLRARRREQLPFDQWMLALDAEAAAFGMVGEEAPSLLGEEVWTGYWQDGLTPMEALQEDYLADEAREKSGIQEAEHRGPREVT